MLARCSCTQCERGLEIAGWHETHDGRPAARPDGPEANEIMRNPDDFSAGRLRAEVGAIEAVRILVNVWCDIRHEGDQLVCTKTHTINSGHKR